MDSTFFTGPKVRKVRNSFLAILVTALVVSTMIALPIGAARGQACQTIFTDEDFTNSSVWTTQSNGTYPLVDDYRYLSPSLAIHLGGVNNAVDKIAATISLPQDTSIYLEFWWYVDTIDDDDNAGFDYLSVEIADAAGNVLQQLQPVLSNYDAATKWQAFTANLGMYAGQTIQIRFVAQTDERNITDFYIDNLTVSGCDWDFNLFLPLSQN